METSSCGIADIYAHQLQTPNLSEFTFEERIGMLVDAEYTARQNHRLTRLLREARLQVQAHPEDMDYHQARGVLTKDYFEVYSESMRKVTSN